MAKALLIDDDKKHSELLRAYFKRCGINRVCAYEVESGFRLFNREGPKLLLLDVMLPDKDGFKISGGGVLALVSISKRWSRRRTAGICDSRIATRTALASSAASLLGLT